MAFNTESIDVTNLRINTGILARTAQGFNVPTIISTISRETFAGPLFDEISESFPNAEVTDRTTSNAWEDENFIARINALKKDRLVICGLWTSVCCNGPVLSALDQGFEVYVVADACGDCSLEAHERAMERMIQAGARPITALTYLLELQRALLRAEMELDPYPLVHGIDHRKRVAAKAVHMPKAPRNTAIRHDDRDSVTRFAFRILTIPSNAIRGPGCGLRTSFL